MLCNELTKKAYSNALRYEDDIMPKCDLDLAVPVEAEAIVATVVLPLRKPWTDSEGDGNRINHALCVSPCTCTK